MLAFNDLVYRYRSGFAVGPISAEIDNSVVCVIGSNGAGKSTLFRMLAGLIRPSRGTIERSRGAATGYLPQEMEFPTRTNCEEFLHFVAWAQGIPAGERPSRVERALSEVGLLDRRGQRVSALSGGMRRRLGIAHALVHRPDVLLLDEPTVGLDPVQRIAVRSTIKSVASERVVIIASHLVEDVRALADRVLVLNEGTVAYDGDVSGLEQLADADAPGESLLEQAMATLMVSAG